LCNLPLSFATGQHSHLLVREEKELPWSAKKAVISQTNNGWRRSAMRQIQNPIAKY
jgi:hypothetical protein